MGKGTVGSRVNVNSGGAVSAGDTLIALNELKLSGGLTVLNGGEVHFPVRWTGSSVFTNRIKVTGALTINGGTLVIDIKDDAELPAGTVLTLFSSLGTVGGTGFSAVVPERPSATTKWDLSTVLTDGKVRVANDETAVGQLKADAKSSTVYDLKGRNLGTGDAHHKGIVVKDGRKYISK